MPHDDTVPMTEVGARELEELFEALGAHLRAAGTSASLLVVGGAALALRGWVHRTTQDVDVLACEVRGELVPPDLSEPLVAAVRRVARDFGVADGWLNAAVGAQWTAGLPDEASTDIEWREYGGLRIGLAGRQALITLKLFAAVDHGLTSVHVQDMMALEASPAELEQAKAWVLGQDLAPEFPSLVDQVVRHVQRRD